MKTNYMLFGRPGIGKTTLLIKIAEQLSALSIGGFFTREIREKRVRVGFGIETFAGESGTLANVSYKAGPRVGKYGVNLSEFERIGVRALENAVQDADVILIDEIGRMELFSHNFRQVLVCALDSEKPVIATVMARPHPFADRLKRRTDVQLIEINLASRNSLSDKLAQRVKAAL